MPTKKIRKSIGPIPANPRGKVATGRLEPLAKMRLEELRRARQTTQVELARSLGVYQGEVSKIEHRHDICVRTLFEYVKALGGRLEIRAAFPDREVRITQFEDPPHKCPEPPLTTVRAASKTSK